MTRPAKRATSRPGPVTRRRPFRRRASSLVITLLVIVVLSTIVVAFMQSMSIERLTAKSAKNTYVSELAAEAAIQQATARIRSLMLTNTYHSIGYTNIGGQLLTILAGSTTYTNTAAPAIHYLLSVSNSTTPPSSLDSTNSIAINKRSGGDSGWIGSPVTNGVISYRECRSPWIYILKDPTRPHQPDSGQPNHNPYISRYAFWIEDETSKLDLQVVGNNDNAGGFRRYASTNTPGNIDAGSLPVLNGNPIPTNNASANNSLIEFRNSIGSLPIDGNIIGQATTFTNAAETARFYATLAGHANDLTGTGRRRVNINSIVTQNNSSAEVIAADLDDLTYVITGSRTFGGLDNATHSGQFLNLPATNGPLPNFGSRFYAGASAAHRSIYLKKLAANIRDYIDTDSQPTVIDSSGVVLSGTRPTAAFSVQPQAIGKEAIPYFQEHAWAGFEESWSGTGTTRVGTVEIDHYLEFFNPSTKDFVAPAGTFIKLHDLPAWMAGTHPWIEPDEFELDISGVTFPAGQAIVITTQPDVGQDPPGLISNTSRLVRITPSTGNAARRFENRTTNESISATRGFQLDSRDTTVTDYRSKLVFGNDFGYFDSHPFVAISMGSAQTFNFKGENVGNRTRFVYSTSIRGNDDSSRSGDPRSLSEQLTLAGYGVGGNDTSRFFGNIQGTGAIPGNSTFTSAAMSFVSPTIWPDYHIPLANTSGSAYAVVRDGSMQSIGELGHIYDPHRVASSSGISYSRGGGRTLKVGQADNVIGSTTRFSPAWQNAAWRLCDIFMADVDTSIVLADAQSRGKININSVMRDDGIALKGLLRNFVFSSAPDGDPVTSGSALSETEATALIASIKNYISTNGPIMERGELSQVPFFNTGTAGGANMTTTIDRGREEIFRRMIELITTKSSAFSVFAVGQAVQEDANGNIKRLAETRIGQVFRFDPTIGNSLSDTVTDYTPTLLYERP